MVGDKDVIGLVVKVNAAGAVKGFNKIEAAGVDAGRKVGKEFRGTTKEVDHATKAAAGLSREMGIVTSSMKSLGIAVGAALTIGAATRLAGEVLQLKDTYSLLSSQIRLVVDSEETLAKVEEKLLSVANDTRQSYESTVQLYTRLDRATKQLGISDEEVLKVTKTLNEAIIVSGASATEASAAVIQLSQGLASGRLSGDELRSVLEQVPRVAQLIADGMGIATGQLRAFGEAGLLTTEAILGAVKGQADQINKEFGKIGETTGQTWQVLKNNIADYINDLDLVEDFQSVFNKTLKGTAEIVKAIAKEDEAATFNRITATKLQSRSLEDQTYVYKYLLNERFKLDAAIARGDAEAGSSQDKLISQLVERADVGRKLIRERDRAAERAARLIKGEIAYNIAARDAVNARYAAESANLKEIIALDEVRDKNIQRQKETVSAANEAAFAKRFEFERDIASQAEELNRTDYENRLARIYAEQDAQFRAASDVYDNEAELYAATDKIAEVSAQRRISLSNEIRAATIRNSIDAAAAVTGALRAVDEENKGFAVADIIVNAARGVQRSFADLPPPFNAIQAGAIVTTSGVQIAKVKNAKYAEGTEFVEGPGTGTSDSVSAKVSRGERIFKARDNAIIGNISNEEAVSRIVGGGGGGNIYVTVNTVTADMDSLSQLVTDASAYAKEKSLSAGFV